MKASQFLASCTAALVSACAATETPTGELGPRDGGGGAPSASGGSASAGSGSGSSVGGTTNDASAEGASAGGSATGGVSVGDGSTGGVSVGDGSTGGVSVGDGSTGGVSAGDGSTGGADDGSAGEASAGDGSKDRDSGDGASSDGPRDGGATACGAEPFDGGYPGCAMQWVRQFGGPNDDGARSVAVDGNGNIYVAGVIGGQLPGGPAIAGGSFDAYVRKYGANGVGVWTRQFGSSGDDAADSVTVDASGNVYVAGSAGAALPDQTAFGAWDVFVRKYDGDGNETWTRQFGSSGYDTGRVTVDTGGNVIVSGLTEGGLPGQGDGGVDAAAVGYAFVRKYDSAGAELWTRQFESSAAQVGDTANIVGAANVDGAGNIYFAGTTDGTLPGQTSAGGEDAFLRKYDGSGNELWTRQFGTSANDGGSAASADPAGDVYVVGRTFGALPNGTNVGAADAFVRKYDGSGTELWTQQFGTAAPDLATAIQVDGAGTVYVGGNTSGTLPGQTSAGSTDAFIRGYDGSGTELGTRQFGTTDIERDLSLSVAPGALYVAGRTNGAFHPNMGNFDAFLIKFAR